METTIDLSEVMRFVTSLGEVEERVMDEVERATVIGTGLIEQQVVARTPVGATGNLRLAWGTDVKRGAGIVRGEVVNPLAYGLPVEKGRKAGKMPPIAPIQLWVTRVLGLSGYEARSAAYVIARAIGKRGTRAANMLKEGFAASEPVVLNLFEEIPQTIIAELAND